MLISELQKQQHTYDLLCFELDPKLDYANVKVVTFKEWSKTDAQNSYSQ